MTKAAPVPVPVPVHAALAPKRPAISSVTQEPTERFSRIAA